MIIQPIKPIHKIDSLKKVGCFLIGLSLLLCLYAPFLASDQPFIEFENQKLLFPFFKSLLSPFQYPFLLDRFLNIAALLWPLGYFFKKFRKRFFIRPSIFAAALGLFFILGFLSIETKGRISPQLSFQMTPLIAHNSEKMVLKSSTHLLGLEKKSQSGQNLAAKVLFGMRYSFSLAFLSCSIALGLGMIWGTVSGYCGGFIDHLLCRLLEIWDSIPTLLIVLVVVQFSFQPSFFFKAVLLALLSLSSFARMVRLEILKNKCLPFVEVLRNLELSPLKICLVHLLPCSFRSLLVLFPFALVGSIMYESALSFMGIGQLERSSLGRLIEEARMVYPLEPSLFWPPAIVLFLTLSGWVIYGDTLKKEALSLSKKKTF